MRPAERCSASLGRRETAKLQRQGPGWRLLRATRSQREHRKVGKGPIELRRETLTDSSPGLTKASGVSSEAFAMGVHTALECGTKGDVLTMAHCAVVSNSKV